MVRGGFSVWAGSVLPPVPSQAALPGNGAIHISVPGMSVQVPRESVEKHSGLNPFTVTNVSVLFQVESERTVEGAISVKWECRWVENDLWARKEKNSDDDSIRSWFRSCGGEKLNSLCRRFFSHQTQLFWVWACNFAQECEHLSANTSATCKIFQQKQKKKKSHGCSLIASACCHTHSTLWNRYSQNFVLEQYCDMPSLNNLSIKD